MSQSKGPVRRRFFNRVIHQHYGGSLAFLFVLLVGVVALVTPLVVGAIRISVASPGYAFREFIILAETIWPGIPAFIIVAAAVSIHLTKRHGGPLYRVHMVCKELAAGRLSSRMFFRSSDHLDDLADQYNEGVERLDDALGTARVELDALRKTLAAVTDQLAEHDLEAARQSVKGATAVVEQLTEVVGGFEVSGR
ncbi:MAG: hypothetical protein DRI90_06215 [Deltaproteobacteria bacterium]|nr:MAG: hypothetical protein DRI90_06215 [Deltaproteobacteria bacterium]